MYGLINKLVAAPGKRGELARIIADSSRGLSGCVSYTVALDRAEPDALWVTEVWQDKAAHDGSLQNPEVRAAIERGRPLVAGFALKAETEPVG
jgi:quinol monooxygenase YgiN